MVGESLPEGVRRELLFLLSCLHKDAPPQCVEWITSQVERGEILDRTAVAYSLGDVSKEWQGRILQKLASKPDNAAVAVFSYAIWRDSQFVNKFSLTELVPLVNVVSERIKKLHPRRSEDGVLYLSARPLELLLGLLRTRASNDPKVRMLLQPNQKVTKQFAEQIDRIEEIVAKSNIALFSRVQIDVQKPVGVRTPDLLYALRLYLTGDDGANAIHITGISDTEQD
jgi:hypothetical protein